MDCNSIYWVWGIKLTFYNLCDQQSLLRGIGANELPAPLPAGVSYLLGVDVTILNNGQVMPNLPDGTGIELDYPLLSINQLAVLHWNDPDGDGQGEWVEVMQPLNRGQLPQALATESESELYKINTLSGGGFYPILTTDTTGIFILVAK